MTSFDLLGLSKPVLRAISDLGFETPTPIQEQAIPVMLGGDRDVVALAQTGTGKTAAFGLPLIELLDFNQRTTQALILSPTRELCMQIARDITEYSKYQNGSHVVAIYGGASIENQIKEVRKGPQIIVATPGRLVDMIERGVVHLSDIDFVVLDEADEMLTMGFKDDLDKILSETPDEKLTWLFSATMPQDVLRISGSYMEDPFEVTVGKKNSGNENIEHLYYVVNPRDRYLALKRIADNNPDIFAIVFCRTKAETQKVADSLIKDGYSADALHGDLSQAQRDFVMKRYRSHSLQMLVATDVAARGIDVDDVTHVINLNLPDEPESYTHRSGRTARAGKTGVSIAIISGNEISKIRQIEKVIKRQFTQAPIPTGFEVCEQQLLALAKKLNTVEVNEKSIAQYLDAVYEEVKDLSREDIIKRFVSLEFNRFAEYYRNAPDLNVSAQKGEQRKTAPGLVKMYINVGDMDGFDSDTLKEFISENAEISVQDITWVDLKNTFSLIEVRTEASPKIIEEIHGAQYQGRTVRVESRGNRDAGIQRTRLRSERRNDGGRRDYGHSHSGSGYKRGNSKPHGNKSKGRKNKVW